MANTLSMMKSKDVGLLGGCKMLLLAALLFCSVAGRADVAEQAQPTDEEAVIVAQQVLTLLNESF